MALIAVVLGRDLKRVDVPRCVLGAGIARPNIIAFSGALPTRAWLHAVSLVSWVSGLIGIG